MAFSQAVSGLNAASSNLDVIGNNIANSATNGFKSSTATFADMMAGSGAGLGVKLAGIQQDFGNGTATLTGKSSDLAITGNGFFRLENTNGEVFYSRNGQFTQDKDGYLTNAQGMRVTGYPANEVNGEMVIQKGGAPTTIKIPTGVMNAKSTTTGSMQVNLNSKANAIDKSVIPFDTKNRDSYSFSAPMYSFDSLGNKHELQVYFAKRPQTGTNPTGWDVYAVDPTVTPPTGVMPPNMTLQFNNQGKLVTGSTTITDVPVKGLNGAANSVVKLDFAGSVQQSFNASNLGDYRQNGYETGQFSAFEIEDDGTISAKYSNNEKQKVGQVVLASFASTGGLESKGDNVWAETGNSGAPIIGVAGTGKLGTLKAGAVEASNVDMGKELVAMIVAQRNYQSNAQTIKAQDQILQTLVSLR